MFITNKYSSILTGLGTWVCRYHVCVFEFYFYSGSETVVTSIITSNQFALNSFPGFLRLPRKGIVVYALLHVEPFQRRCPYSYYILYICRGGEWLIILIDLILRSHILRIVKLKNQLPGPGIAHPPGSVLFSCSASFWCPISTHRHAASASTTMILPHMSLPNSIVVTRFACHASFKAKWGYALHAGNAI